MTGVFFKEECIRNCSIGTLDLCCESSNVIDVGCSLLCGQYSNHAFTGLRGCLHGAASSLCAEES